MKHRQEKPEEREREMLNTVIEVLSMQHSPSKPPGLNITESQLADSAVAKAERNSNIFQQRAVGTANPMKEWD